MIRIYTIKSKQNEYLSFIKEYQKRIPDIKIIPVTKESKIPQHYIALTEEGITYTSKEFAEMITKLNQKDINFVIGPAEGLSETITKNAQKCISLSKLTFPHEIALLLLIEQLYRAHTIKTNHPYHK